ncbi:MAG TPA: hypothetical protein VGJ55_15105 [Pyrinomonadaceae bacterium]
MSATLKTPVAFIIFNRPETTARVFAEIAKARPSKLLLIADGPRADRPGESEKCAATRAVVEKVDWDCEVLRNFSEVNLGCGSRPASGINWVFQNVDEAIIIEDDCLPHPTFFRFCDELLARYRDDERIMMISGNNFQDGKKRTSESYYFSRYAHTWGWATWRRAWQLYDFEIKLWPQLRETLWLLDTLGDEESAAYWRATFDGLSKTPDVWDYQWTFTCWAQNCLAILPNANLVSNIGWGEDATHTTDWNNSAANLPTEPMQFPLNHPAYMVRNREADDFSFQNHFGGRAPTLSRRLRGKVKSLLSKLG